MNIQADPVGYKALSRHFANASRTDSEVAEEVRDQGQYIRWSAYALIALAAGLLLALLYVAREIAMPVIMGLVVGLFIAPLADRGQRFGIPAPLTTLAVVALVIGAVGGALYLILPGVSDFAEAAPRISAGFQRIVNSIGGLISVFDLIRDGAADGAALVTKTETSKVDMAAKIASFLTPALAQTIIFLFTLLLFSASRGDIRSALVRSFNDRERRLSALRSFNEAENKLTDYIVTVFAINVGLGAAVGVTMWLAGVPGALVWGFLAFILNFLPVVGPLLLKIALVVFGLAAYPTIAGAMIPIAVFLAISMVEANVVTPRIVGNKITMNALAVFLSVVFWTWMWGFAGAFLAMPLLAIASVVHDEFRSDPSPKLPV
jgi:predicted PurR-regulated permease PerM